MLADGVGKPYTSVLRAESAFMLGAAVLGRVRNSNTGTPLRATELSRGQAA